MKYKNTTAKRKGEDTKKMLLQKGIKEGGHGNGK